MGPDARIQHEHRLPLIIRLQRLQRARYSRGLLALLQMGLQRLRVDDHPPHAAAGVLHQTKLQPSVQRGIVRRGQQEQAVGVGCPKRGALPGRRIDQRNQGLIGLAQAALEQR